MRLIKRITAVLAVTVFIIGTYFTAYAEETKAPDGYAKLKNTINKTISVDENAPQTVTVEEKVTNKTESWLPETGGMGTVIFTVVGVVGVLAILSTYFKKGKKEEA